MGGTPKSSIFSKIFHYEPSSYWGSPASQLSLEGAPMLRPSGLHGSMGSAFWELRTSTVAAVANYRLFS